MRFSKHTRTGGREKGHSTDATFRNGMQDDMFVKGLVSLGLSSCLKTSTNDSRTAPCRLRDFNHSYVSIIQRPTISPVTQTWTSGWRGYKVHTAFLNCAYTNKCYFTCFARPMYVHSHLSCLSHKASQKCIGFTCAVHTVLLKVATTHVISCATQIIQVQRR